MIRTALKNPYLVLVLVLMVAVIGAISMARIPADLLPTYKTSAVQIVTFYPGMPPEVMEGDIMSRLQRWTGQSSRIEHQEAKAMQGVCIVKDFFHPEVSSSEALAQVSMYAMSDMFYLPPGTIPPMVMPFDPTASVPLCLVSVSNPDMNDSELYDIAYKNLRNNLQSISGVIAPAVNGGALRRILAYVDPEKLRAYNISILEPARPGFIGARWDDPHAQKGHSASNDCCWPSNCLGVGPAFFIRAHGGVGRGLADVPA